jgi:hypothetical protein
VFIYENKLGTFSLMADAPHNHFEVCLHTGERLKYRLGGKTIHLRRLDGSSEQLQPWQDWKTMGTQHQKLVQICLQCLKTVQSLFATNSS